MKSFDQYVGEVEEKMSHMFNKNRREGIWQRTSRSYAIVYKESNIRIRRIPGPRIKMDLWVIDKQEIVTEKYLWMSKGGEVAVKMILEFSE